MQSKALLDKAICLQLATKQAVSLPSGRPSRHKVAAHDSEQAEL